MFIPHRAEMKTKIRQQRNDAQGWWPKGDLDLSPSSDLALAFHGAGQTDHTIRLLSSP